MPGTKSGGQRAAATNLARDPDFYRKIGAAGGEQGRTGGFANNRALAKIAGRKGGLASRRPKGSGKPKHGGLSDDDYAAKHEIFRLKHIEDLQDKAEKLQERIQKKIDAIKPLQERELALQARIRKLIEQDKK